MKTNIIIKKVWEDDFSSEFNVKFESEVNREDFIVSGNFYLSGNDVFNKLSKALSNGTGSVVFEGVNENYCKLTVDKNARGLININYQLFVKDYIDDSEDRLDVSLNTGYILEPASVDRNVDKLKEFYSSPEGTEISLIYSEE